MKIFDIYLDKSTCKVNLDYTLKDSNFYTVTICDFYSDCVYFTWGFEAYPNGKFWIVPLHPRLVKVALENINFPGFTAKVYNKELRLLQSQKLKLHSSSKPYTQNHYVDPLDANGASFIDFFYSDICKNIDFSDVVVDAGANVGFFTLYSNIHGAKRIYSIEPDPASFFYLQKNFESYDNIICLNKGMNIADDGMNINLCLDSSVATSEFLNIGKIFKIFVPTISIDTLLKIENEINLMKLDIEGTEFNVIEKLKPEHFSKINQFFIEFHGNPKPILSKLVESGYKTEYRHSTENDTAGFIYANK